MKYSQLNRVKVRDIYCYWLILWVLLYNFNIISINPFPSLLLGLIFTIIFLNTIPNIDTRFIWICVFWHIVLLLMVDINYDKKTLLINILVFLIYILYLNFTNNSFYKVYFIDIVKYYKNRPFSLKKYISSIVSNI